ncbi:MAG: Gfo/Idh/MocA family oxidoreductase [Candidatus Sumerlaeota bacterium]|nr:Gfo/Idh/MocA family oxidoreductase [Candidatus Sumerlaeota bacterium]
MSASLVEKSSAQSGDGQGISRRAFVTGAGAAAAAAALAGCAIVPRNVVAGAPADAGQAAPSKRINVACIGVGAQGLRVMLAFLKQPDVQITAVCDVNKQASDYPQWGANEFRESVRKMLGADYSTWGEWLSTDHEVILTRTKKVTGGAAGREPCRQIVDAYYASLKRSGKYKGCAAYSDFRELLEKEKDLDAVVIGTPDHWHAPIAIAAMKKGKHVYCQKPMTRLIAEARHMADVARETKVATQVAIGNQASETTRQLCEWIWDGAIGPVRQVINWSSRPFWPQGLERPKEEEPVPEGLDWDLWLGPAPVRPYNHIYLPFNWRGWYDFGCGALGDMGCYSFDTIFRVLKLEAPVSAEASSSEMYPETYPKSSIINFNFPARGDMPPVKLTWYDGGLKPACPEELSEKGKLADEGLIFTGDKGSILCGFLGERPALIPESKMKDYKQAPKTLPRSIGHEREWLEACKGAKEKPGANFEFESLVTETILLGNVALRAKERILWDRANMKAANTKSAEQYIRTEYRQGWTL